MWIKGKINPPCCGIFVHRRYGSIVCRVTCGDVCIEKGDFCTQGCKTGGVKTCLSPGSAFYFQIRRGTLREISGLHRATYRKQGAERWNSRYGIPAALARQSLWVEVGAQPAKDRDGSFRLITSSIVRFGSSFQIFSATALQANLCFCSGLSFLGFAGA